LSDKEPSLPESTQKFRLRRREKEITNIGEIEKIIKKAQVCRLGLVDGDEPYVVPVFFGYEKNALYFHSALEGRKIDLLKRNNKVCFEIDTDVEVITTERACGFTAKYRSVIGVGRAYILDNDNEKIHGLNVLMKQYAEGEFSFPKEKLERALVVRIDIESITGKQSGY
jgi:nitroimidazol reductase NimA-like FMN-containing flavoprotein (pyridoxamine 5'-phosphate oxidase superfamily)